MRILLPPSESKTTPAQGKPLDLLCLSHPDLTAPRRALLAALTTVCTDEPSRALSVLGLTSNQTEEVVRNQTLWTAPAAPAWQIYTGVLYGELDAATLTPLQRARLAERVWIASALFGFVDFSDPIPAYRLSGDATLPNIGALTGFWREHLTPLLEREPGLIVDLRSGTYVKLAPLPASVGERAVVPRVLQKMPSGPPKLLTHFNKATKGRLVRAMAQYKGQMRSPQDFAQLVAKQGMDVTLTPPVRSGQAYQMDIVTL